MKSLKTILLVSVVLVGCTPAVPDDWYHCGPESVRRVEPSKDWYVFADHLIVTAFPGYFEARIVHPKTNKIVWVPITWRQFEDAMRWGYKKVSIVNGKGVLQDPDDFWTYGASGFQNGFLEEDPFHFGGHGILHARHDSPAQKK